MRNDNIDTMLGVLTEKRALELERADEYRRRKDYDSEKKAYGKVYGIEYAIDILKMSECELDDERIYVEKKRAEFQENCSLQRVEDVCRRVREGDNASRRRH